MTGFNNSNQIESPDYTGYFLGTVVDNNDPTHRQRVKVNIPDLLVGLPALLPWVSPILQSDFGVTSSAGVMQVPAVGSVLLVEFQNGELLYGLSSGCLHTASHSPAAELLVNYPNRRGWKDPSGNLFYIDSTEGSVEAYFRHVSGTFIKVANNGDVTVSSPQKVTVTCTEAIVNASVGVSLNTPLTTATGNLVVGGTISAVGDITTPADVVAGLISLKLHKTSGVRSGGDISGVPVP